MPYQPYLRGHYILEGRKVVPEPDLLTWATWFEKAREERIVKQENIGGVKVSTVFLGLEHGGGEDAPILWETMVFPGDTYQEEDMERCAGTWEDALAMHDRMVEKVRDSQGWFQNIRRTVHAFKRIFHRR